MNNLHRAYRAIIYALYVKFHNAGEVFTQSMERNIREVEYTAELARRGSVLKSNDQSKGKFERIFKI